MDNARIFALVVRWLILAFAIWVAAELIAGIHLEGLTSILLVAAILGLLNMFVRPVLVLLSCPLTILTLGLFLLVINALMLLLAGWIAEQTGEIQFSVDNFLAALLGAIVISIVNLVVGLIIRPEPV